MCRRRWSPLGAGLVLAGLVASGCGSRSGLLGDDERVAEELEPQGAAGARFTPLLPPEEERAPLPRPEPALEGCVDRRFSYDTLPPTVLLLIDQSGSMEFGFGGGGSRWDVLRNAVVDPDEGVLSRLDTSVRFGLMLYTSFDGFRRGTCPMLTESRIAIGNAESLSRLSSLAQGRASAKQAIEAEEK